MNVPVTSCPRCGTRRTARDIASGAALARNGTIFCATCIPASPIGERQTVDSGSDIRTPSRTPPSGRWGPASPTPLSPSPPSATPPSGRVSVFPQTPAPPSPSPDAPRRASARRPRPRPAPPPPEPFPWGLVLAGFLVSCTSTVLLALLLRALFPPPPPPPSPATPAVVVPTGPKAHELADSVIARARACEAQNDLESACLALDLPASSPILADPESAALVSRERERLTHLRDQARARHR
ncbi:MAG TPA: hypothetical protein VFF73_35780 [Planctomycetota bacterium]|nr:hypothetical protein [Planctomycetota bacterium]